MPSYFLPSYSAYDNVQSLNDDGKRSKNEWRKVLFKLIWIGNRHNDTRCWVGNSERERLEYFFVGFTSVVYSPLLLLLLHCGWLFSHST